MRIKAIFSTAGHRVSAETEIELVPGAVAGAADCLGPGQSFSSLHGHIVPNFTRADVLPVVIHAVEPDYPKSAAARGIEDGLPVAALVCRSGAVLDAYVAPSYRAADGELVVHDPKLVEAALAAVRQYVFSPALVSGEPIAVWVTVPVRFGP